jgi:hypothetical protein
VENQLWPTAFGKDKIKGFFLWLALAPHFSPLLATIGRACICHTEAAIVSVLAWRAGRANYNDS